MLRRLFGEKCYDTKTRSIYYLFRSELNAKYIMANIEGTNHGTVWIKSEDIALSNELRHPPLSGENKDYVLEIMDNLRGVYDLSYDEWETGFRKDFDLEKNIAIWSFFSDKFKSIQDSLILNDIERKELFRMMVAVMNNGASFAISNMKYQGQIEELKDELVRRYVSPEAPGA